ncbi:LysR family transcriptional regulator [Tropicibacter oceani]|uniref:LysR family transcriptional regulator n=1 Tax=Tropicibacter oceani TaxID=3058420 RepID=A0ABY8QM85_9RHOB|nr:LysR family transcriptional regulator [Tropicibacter oceani]WGW05750.1 LysR family transcriptional regulator [Tropicibacter oceani]
MPPSPPRKDLSLRALELFQICAQKGSLMAAAEETGLSVSTVSHHLRNLEEHLGTQLFNHARRPMVLTPKGRSFLRNIDEALHALRKAKAAAMGGSVADTRHLRIGTIEDFDSDITPELAVYLNERMPLCDFTYHTDDSHSIIEMLSNRKLDLGVTSKPSERMRDLQDQPLLRDPFIVVLPQGHDDAPGDILAGKGKLPFLRFSGNLIIARQIEAHLRRIGATLPHRFECGNNQTLMAMVAAGAGWTITTPLLFARARRFQPRLRMHPFPGKRFSRTLVIVSTPECADTVVGLVHHRLRALITEHALRPIHASAPWLVDRFTLIS